MIYHLEIPDTTAILYTVIAVLTVVSAYVYGWAIAKKKYQTSNDAIVVQARLEYIQALESEKGTRDKLIESMKEIVDTYKDMHRLDQKIIAMWEGKYTALQQEIECHIHEVYEEAEKPHIEKTWPVDKNSHSHKAWQEYVNEPEETPAEKEKEAYWDAENEFWESVRRMHKNEHN